MAGSSDAVPGLRCVQSGDRVNGFVVGKRMTRGGLCDLYHCHHPDHTGPLVIKVPRLGPEEPRMAMAAFENEVRILEQLKASCIPRVIAVGDLFQTPYYVMEFLPGNDYERAAADAPLGVEPLCELGARLARAVHALHRHNVIHLDLNPNNVRTRPDGRVVLIDFGLAHHARLPDLIDAAFGEEEGTTAYISPEQVCHVRSDFRSDIYAIGAILYRYATGHFPFGRANLFSLRKRLHELPVPPRVHRPDLPPWLQEVILRCLERHPRDRYPTARQVAYALSHPGSVTLTARAHRVRAESPVRRFWRWLRTWTDVFEHEPGLPVEHLASAPHALVALDLDHSSEALRVVLRQAVRKFVRSEPHSYVTVVTVMARDAASQRPVSAHLAELHHWAQPLKLDESRIFYQVLPGGDPADVLIEYSRHHQVDHVIMGARKSSRLRRHLGSVSSRVVAEAHCAVTVVRSQREFEADLSSTPAENPADEG